MKITVFQEQEIFESFIDSGQSLLDAINKVKNLAFDAPCGGKGTCGKCRIKIKGESEIIQDYTRLYPPDFAEKKFLTKNEISEGVRLACRIFPIGDMELSIPYLGRDANIQVDFLENSNPGISNSLLKKHYLIMPKPYLSDQRSDAARFIDALKLNIMENSADHFAKEPVIKIELPIIRILSEILHNSDFKLTALILEEENILRVISIEQGNTTEMNYGIAVDIGTTTVVSYLVNMITGKVVDAISGLNEQKGYGSDVISRIEYTMQDRGNIKVLQQKILKQIKRMLLELSSRNNISLKSISLLNIVGNTTMVHIFSGVDIRRIGVSPFIPVYTSSLVIPVREIDPDFSEENMSVSILPCISSYIGADIVAGVAASGMTKSEELSLFIDIGTNGEIVLGRKSNLKACSTAAGPALEGANISCGMGGIPGAINAVRIGLVDGPLFNITVIGNGKPVGICGSGIIDAIAVFYQLGIIDKTGHLLNSEELSESYSQQSFKGYHSIDDLLEVLCEKDGMAAVRIVNIDGRDICLTQKDIREVQMAKSAIAAGIKTLCCETATRISEIENVYIAGGFGSFMNKHSAAIIGLIPPELESRTESIGNAAGLGAVYSAISTETYKEICNLGDHIQYVELSGNAVFQEEYMLEMYFPGFEKMSFIQR